MSYEEARILKERAEAFLDNAKSLFAQGKYDLAAFNIEQFCQLAVKTKLLAKTGTYPRTHSLLGLMRILGPLEKGGKIESFIEKELLFITKVEDAYIVARYLPRRYEKAEVAQLIDFAERLNGVIGSDV